MTIDQVLDLVRTRLSMLPTARIINTTEWNAITIDQALDAIDRVAEDLRSGEVAGGGS